MEVSTASAGRREALAMTGKAFGVSLFAIVLAGCASSDRPATLADAGPDTAADAAADAEGADASSLDASDDADDAAACLPPFASCTAATASKCCTKNCFLTSGNPNGTCS